MALYRPDPSTHGPGPYPTILSVYGGPHVQLVQNNFLLTASMREQFYCAEGFLVAKVCPHAPPNMNLIMIFLYIVCFLCLQNSILGKHSISNEFFSFYACVDLFTFFTS
jgi:hypothetical protein